MGNVKFLFKDDAYEFRELFSMYLTGKNLFKSGEVINSTTGESFDISEICDIKNRYRHLLEDSVHNIGNMHDKRIRWAIENEEKEKRYLELKNLYEKKNIEIDEMFEYLKLKKDIDKTFIKGREMFSMNYEKFITLNIGERLPDGLCKADKGRFYDMLFFLSYDNKLKQSSRKNGRIIKKEDLMEELELSNYNSYRKFMSKLSSLNIIREVPTTNKTKVIILNPIYVIYPNFSLKQYHIDLFGEELFEMYYETVDDLSVIEKYKHLLSDIEYQKIIFKLNPKKYYTVFDYPLEESGIYVLFNNYNVVYIGKSDNMKNRINQHKKDKEFNSVKCILFKDKGMVNLYEPYLIQKYNPIYNKDLIDKTDMCLPDISFYNKGEDTVWKN